MIKHLTNSEVKKLILNSSALIEVILDLLEETSGGGEKPILDSNQTPCS